MILIVVSCWIFFLFHYPGTFLLYSGFSMLGFIFVFTMLPETKDKPLEEVIDLFAQPMHSSSCCSGGRSHIRYTKLKVGKLYIQALKAYFMRSSAKPFLYRIYVTHHIETYELSSATYFSFKIHRFDVNSITDLVEHPLTKITWTI